LFNNKVIIVFIKVDNSLPETVKNVGFGVLRMGKLWNIPACLPQNLGKKQRKS